MHYKTKESETIYLTAYKAAMKSWPVPWEEIEVSNRFGTTYVVASGPEEAPPLVLLHGFFTTLLLWAPNIADLSNSYRVYAIDIMGNRNRSVPQEPIGTSEDFVEWLSETLHELKLKKYLLGRNVFRRLA